MPKRPTLNPVLTATPILQPMPRSKLNKVTEVTLIARAAGRCEFCNAFLYAHPMTGETGNFAENAHIVAFSERGPRGDGNRPEAIDDVENLMLLCAPDHKLIDDNPERYTREVLVSLKHEHEARIKRVTAVGRAMRTSVLQLKAKIGSSIVEVSRSEVFEALQPRYPADDPHIIDLTQLGDEQAGAFYELAADRIDKEVARLNDCGSSLERSQHLSVFALAPIPLLVSLGAVLSNKVPTDFYQCHRTRSENRWNWYEGELPARFQIRVLRTGNNPTCVAIALSLSGAIDPATLPGTIDERFTLYEITPIDAVPNTGLIRQREDLEAFRSVYRGWLAELRVSHPRLRELHFFPAIPAPVAVACGFDLLPKVDPALVIYDNISKEGGFVARLTVNAHER